MHGSLQLVTSCLSGVFMLKDKQLRISVFLLYEVVYLFTKLEEAVRLVSD